MLALAAEITMEKLTVSVIAVMFVGHTNTSKKLILLKQVICQI